ncbi:MAG: hypothetical protein HY675_18040 [Chloroflexi bacterium]|nr:hypothetical protein [Chloroflexota bacterium]
MAKLTARPFLLRASSPFASALARRTKWLLVLCALATLALTAALSYAED